MEIEFDAEKSARNERERGMSFSDVTRFEWEEALVVADDRRDYGEQRFRALGVISLRKANAREEKRWASE